MPTEMDNTTLYQSAENIIAAARGPAITLNSSAFTINNPWESMIDDKIKKYCESTDKHLDDLEEDIEFLDKERKNATAMLDFHTDKIYEFQSKIDLLQNENGQLHKYLSDLQTQIYMLQEKLDNQ